MNFEGCSHKTLGGPTTKSATVTLGAKQWDYFEVVSAHVARFLLSVKYWMKFDII